MRSTEQDMSILCLACSRDCPRSCGRGLSRGRRDAVLAAVLQFVDLRGDQVAFIYSFEFLFWLKDWIT